MKPRSVLAAAVIAFAAPCAAQTSAYDSASGMLTLQLVMDSVGSARPALILFVQTFDFLE